MNFLIVLLAVVVEFIVKSMVEQRRRGWTILWVTWLEGFCARYQWWTKSVAIAVIVGLPLCVASALFSILHGLAPFLGYLASFATLLLAFGPEDLSDEVETYKNQLAGEGSSGVPQVTFATAGSDYDVGDATDDVQFNATRGDLAALAVSANRAWFVPVMWFFAAGPLGAIAYRLICNLRERAGLSAEIEALLGDLCEALEWLPARLSMFLLGIAGTLLPVLDCGRDFGVFRWGSSRELLARAALAATDNGRIDVPISGDIRAHRIDAMYALLLRTLTAWIVLMAGVALLIR